MKKIVIIGGVAAGATAAARARRLDADAEITILEAGPDVSFANCGLPYYIGGEIAHRSSLILASPETFHDQYRITVHVNTPVSRIDKDSRTVYTSSTNDSEQRFSYDRLILAQGGKPIMPPLPGIEQENVFNLWTLSDMDAINSFLDGHAPRNAVVVGGGFIGIEMVEALAKRGLKVQLVEMASQIMPNLEAELAGFLTKEMQDHGVVLHLGTSLKQIKGTQAELSDGSVLDADVVLMSVGVRPNLQLVKDAGLALGDTGGLLVSDRLQTSDRAIYAAGDMVEIEHRVMEHKVRIPLAGPANRQGRIAAENALGGSKRYAGSVGTSIVKLFDSAAGSTGLSLQAARRVGIAADAVVVHKASHTAYYPGSSKVTLMLVFDRESGRVLGAQAAGNVGVDKRLDVIATAIAGRMTIEDLEELDLAYAPPFNSPNGPVNMAAFTAVNARSGFSPAVLASELEDFILRHQPVAIDLRDPISFRTASLKGCSNVSQNALRERMNEIPRDQTILLISDDGQKGHVALRMLTGAGFTSVYNLSGGYISLERHARAGGYRELRVGLLPVEHTSAVPSDSPDAGSHTASDSETRKNDAALSGDEPLIIDVRTPEEFAMGAFPGAVLIQLDELSQRVSELGSKDRQITLYCASGARSAYGRRILQQLGFTRVENGGGLHDMMMRA